ncbi:MAG: hypothetical protein KJ799_05135 [Bacteroidetes bacterium]|nr:hypothetical protein [Bacteroidota bacterium]MBU2506091.1 hypothetical protein [Bacteroidota bacterium]
MNRILCAAYVTLVLLLTGCSSKTEYLPQELFGLKMVSKLEGSEAKLFVNKLHFQSVTNLENEIGFYEGEKGRLTIFVTYYPDDEAAKNDELKMTAKISPDNSVFMMGDYLEIEGKSIYRCFGMGQTHFVFADQSALLWISCETIWAKEFISNYLSLLN